MIKPKALVFYQYLPPWRIDVFNEMGKYYDLTIAFTNADCDGFKYNRKELLGKLRNINTLFLNNGFKIGSRPVRFGILKLIKEVGPSIVFSHEYSPTSILIALYKQLGIFHYKYYITTSDNLQMAEMVFGLKAKSRGYVLKHSNGIIVYSEVVKQWYQQNFPLLRIEICPNIQKPETLLAHRALFQPIIQKYISKYELIDANIILYTGRLVQVKGLDLLLTAFAKASPENYKLVIVGEGNQHKILLQEAKQLNILKEVIFAGFHSGIELYAWYNIANYLVLPSRYEPFGAVVNEALVYGCPVIASKYIGATEFITQNNGIIFDPLNETEFINIIKQASVKYKKPTSERENLMPCSFNDYVYSFYKISQQI